MAVVPVVLSCLVRPGRASCVPCTPLLTPHAHCVRQFLHALLHDLESPVWPEASGLRAVITARKVTVQLACGRALLASDPSVALCFPLEGLCGVRGGGGSQLGVCVTCVSVPSRPGLRLAGCVCLRGTPATEQHSFSVCASLQLGAPPRCGARAAACIRVGGWSVKYCAFIFIRCSQGIGSIAQKNNLIINPCLHSKSGLSVPV